MASTRWRRPENSTRTQWECSQGFGLFGKSFAKTRARARKRKRGWTIYYGRKKYHRSGYYDAVFCEIYFDERIGDTRGGEGKMGEGGEVVGIV